jgi:ubiquinone/menaquinone biosynthesis C-methylase UbiE
MVPTELYRLLQCPTCASRDLVVTEAGVHCAACTTDYPRGRGYIDLMPRGIAFGYTSKYVSEEEQLSEELDYRDLAPPLLAAGVRDRALARLLELGPNDIVLDSGCGTAKHAVWNAARVRLMVGADPATLFADQALEQVALTKADARRLPFMDGGFDKVFCIDVLEHFPLEVIDAYMAETARVLRSGGRFLAFSNTRDKSALQPLVDLSRWIGRQFVKAGVYDFEREALRKSDHVKALATWEDVLAAMDRAGLRVVKVVFWNSVFTSFVEHVLMKLGEAVLGRKTRQESGVRSQKPEARSPRRDALLERLESTNQRRDALLERLDTPPPNPESPAAKPISDGTVREIAARRKMRGFLERRGPVYYGLMAVTLLMELDLWLFGSLRSGSYFIVVEKP